MNLVLVTGPAVEPVTLTEAKTHLNLTGSSQDTYVTSLITVARRSVERYLNRALITQVWKAYFNNWCNEISLPFGRLQLVNASVDPVVTKKPFVKYYNTEGVLTDLNESDYYWVVNNAEPAKLVRKYDVNYPELQYGRPDSIEVTFQCGYGVAADVPEDIKHGIKLLIGNYHANREDVVIGHTVTKIPSHITDLIHSYKLYEF